MNSEGYDPDRDLGFLYELASGENSEPEDMSPTYAELLNLTTIYTDYEFIAEGGSKQIFRAFDTKAKRHVAIARPNPKLGNQFYEAFLREAQLTASLAHPNIINIHDIDLGSEDEPYFSMDLMRGATLENFIVDRAFADSAGGSELKLNDYLDIFLKICDAIAYAHDEGVLHLDLKPANIYVNQFGEVVVGDWGLAKVVNQSKIYERLSDDLEVDLEAYSGNTLGGEIKGTPGFMAPEQATREAEKTIQTDVYALGAILYNILTRKPPFHGLASEEIVEQTRRKTQVEVDRIDHSQHAFSRGLKAIVHRAMAPEPHQRYSSVKALQDDIRRYQNHMPTHADRPFLWERLVLLFQRNAVVCSVVVAAIIAIIITIFTLLRAAEQQRRVADTRIEMLDTYSGEAKAEIESLSELAGGTLKGYANLRNRLFFHDPLWVMSQLRDFYDQYVALFPDSKKYWEERFYFDIVRMNFEVANEMDRFQDLEVDPNLTDLAASLSDYRFNNSVRPTVDQVLTTLSKVNEFGGDYKELMAMMVYFDAASRGDKNGYDQVVQELVAYYNPNWQLEGFNYDPGQQSLKLGGTGLTSLFPLDYIVEANSFLSLIPIKTLKLSLENDPFELWQLGTLDLVELDVADSLKLSLEGVANFRSLKTLVVAKGQFTDRELAQVPRGVEVIYE
ncbi:serine/threonine-protein kinase [Rubellicoccus peritrichatus]|uniref:Serine/threonine-protein kinase n=1 Tax=Rubellicoccus peritrichatus TaxID=3080537 RepID=A0AAQ3LGY7_9BACT|nr:serine/threonine-protein kinase [Puniceicoccus sp. CR14]WOO43633.1 serine/threonine-protein kinase [Puniceicoccus sp. CR14]